MIGFALFTGAANAAVIVSEATDEGRPAFKITTDVATYYYSKAGASLTSLLDADGVDWIDFHDGSEATNGSFNRFRGLPNMTRQGFGHSTGEGALSVTYDPLDQPLEMATIVSTQGPWQTRFEVFPTFARLTVSGSGEDYWLLYEGVPGGALDPDDLCWTATEEPGTCARRWAADIPSRPDIAPGLEWMVFGDPGLDRSLVLLHNDDEIVDQHRLMEGMTVFGFGRSDPGFLLKAVDRLGLRSIQSQGRLQQANDTLLITFVEAVEADAVEARIRSLALHPSFAPEPESLLVERRSRSQPEGLPEDPS